MRNGAKTEQTFLFSPLALNQKTAGTRTCYTPPVKQSVGILPFPILRIGAPRQDTFAKAKDIRSKFASKFRYLSLVLNHKTAVTRNG